MSFRSGDGNCFYRAFIVAVMEDLCLNRSRAKCERLFGVFQKQKALLQAWQGINNAYYDQVRRGYYLLKVMTAFIHSFIHSFVRSFIHSFIHYTLFLPLGSGAILAET